MARRGVDLLRNGATVTVSISIVVRTKNRPEYLSRAVRSITSQTFADWQAVIVNDGGDPEPVDAILEAIAPHLRERFTVIHSPSSRGRWASANAGVLATQAPLLVLHDDDDTWSPDFLARANEYMQQHPERDAVVSRIEIVWEERAGDEFEVIRSEVFQPQLHDLLLSDALLFNRFVPIGFVYRRRLHEELGLFREALPVIGDWDFNLKVLATRAVATGPAESARGTPAGLGRGPSD